MASGISDTVDLDRPFYGFCVELSDRHLALLCSGRRCRRFSLNDEMHSILTELHKCTEILSSLSVSTVCVNFPDTDEL